MASTTTTTSVDVPTKIREQIEFYFSDSSFLKDKFLRAQAAKDPEGFVDISVLTTFNRLKNITTDVAVIADALKDSTKVKLNDDKTKVRRADPLPTKDTSFARSVYVKGFPTDATLDFINDYFKKYGKVQYLKMRRFKDRSFKGSVFVEFSTEDEAKAVVASTLTLNDTPLIVKTKTEYVDTKKKEIESKKRTAKEQSKGKKDEEGGDNDEENDDEEEEEEDNEHQDKKQKVERSFTPGKILHFSGLVTESTYEAIKKFFNEIAPVQFVDYDSGSKEGYVRFDTPESTSKVSKTITEEKKEFSGGPLTVKILEGDEEQKYWEKIWANSEERRKNRASGGGRGRKGRRGGRGGRGRGGKGGKGGKGKGN